MLQGSVGGQAVSLTTTFGASTATSELVQNGQKAVNTQVISPRAVVLPDNFFGTYEALAARLANAEPGTTLPLYRVPEGEVAATVDRVTPRRLVTRKGPSPFASSSLTLVTPRGAFPIEVWTDDRQRLARLVLPASSVVVIRDDLTSVMTREDHGQNPGDEAVFIPANGFTIGATITKPTGAAARPPVAILTAGPGKPGRERLIGGVPVFGRLAGTLAAAGFFVVRLRRHAARAKAGAGPRAPGSSRTATTCSALCSGCGAAAMWTANGWSSSVTATADRLRCSPPSARTASRASRSLPPGRSGREAVLEQQHRMLERLGVPEAERAERIALQASVNEAAVTGKGWEAIPHDVRRRPTHRGSRAGCCSIPAITLEEVEQPVLVVQGALDTEASPSDADRLEELARNKERRSAAQTKKVIVTGVNHAFVPATTGATDTSATPSPTMSPEVGRAIAGVVPKRGSRALIA